MNPNRNYGVMLFPSVSHCIRAESLVQAAGLSCKLIPVPRELSSDCGTALRFNWAEREEIAAVLEVAGLETEGVHHLE